MLTHARLTIALCFLGAVGVTSGATGAVMNQSQDWATIKAEKGTQGWVEVAPDVLERRLGDRVEHLGYGQQGSAWIVGELQQRLTFLNETQQANPSEDVEQAIKAVSEALAKARLDLTSSTARPAAPAPDCYVSWDAFANAYPWGAGPGVGAAGNAYVDGNCGYWGEVYAYAHGHATNNGVYNSATQIDGPKSGTSVSAYASVAVAGNASCYSEAYAYATISALGINYSQYVTNSSCPPPVLPVTISGTTYEQFNFATCRSRTWTSSVSGGNGIYSYQWLLYGSVVGTGSSYTRSVCYYDDPGFTLTLNVNDSNGASGSDTHDVTVFDNSGGCTTTCCFTGGSGELPICP